MSYGKTYEIELWFKKDNIFLEIEEPYMFDAFSHTVERKSDGFALDVYLFAENTNLLFTNDVYQKTSEYEDIDGTVLFNLTHGLKRIIDSYNEYGADGEIELRIRNNGSIISKCDFDLEDVDTDLKTYFKCGFIENNIRSKHKIHEDDVMINLYADKNIDGQPIQKLTTKKVLLKSKPTLASSKWIKTDIPYTGSGTPGSVTNMFPAGAGYQFFNFCKNPIEYGIEDTVSPSPIEYANEFVDTYDGTMAIIECKSTKDRVKFVINSDVNFVHIQNGRVGFENMTYLKLFLRVSSGTTLAQSVVYTLYEQEFIGTTIQSATVPPVIEFNLPTKLNDGEFVTIFWEYYWDRGTIALSTDYNTIENYSHVKFNDCTISCEVIETSINSVIQGVRWIDALKKSSEIISGLTVDAPRIDIGGEYYDTIITNGGGMRNISNIPFNVKTKDLFDMGMMVAMDYQICPDKILVGQYSDFFSNRLIRKFNVKPSEKFYWNTNREYRIKVFDYKFENFEQDRQEQRTLDAVHTQEQLLLPNSKPVNPKVISIKQILDGYKIDSLKRLGLDPETKDSSLSDDTDIVMLKIRPLAQNHTEEYLGLMNITTIPNGLKIYSTTFKWDKIGLGLSSSFEIVDGDNAGSYGIVSIESNLLTLSSTIVNKSESKILTIRYSLEDVEFVSETNEGFESISGILSPETCTNIFYTKSRNIIKWMPYLATCVMHYIGAKIKVSFLKSNQDLATKKFGEVLALVEKADIDIDSIAETKRVTDRTFKISIYPDNPENIKEIFEEQNSRNLDGSIGGYYEFIGPNSEPIFGYPKTLEYIPRENRIEALCFEKYTPGGGFINLIDSQKNLYSQYFAKGIYFTIYNSDGSVFCREKRFTKIKINGIIYTDINFFVNDLALFFS